MTEPTPIARPPRRRFALGLRGLMAAVLVLGGGLGYEVREATVQRDAVAAVEAAGGRVTYGSARLPLPKWLVDRVGIDYVAHPVRVDTAGPVKNGRTPGGGVPNGRALVAGAGQLRGLEVLNLIDADVTDADLAPLRGLTNLKALQLVLTRATGAALAFVSGAESLETLDLGGLRVADADLAHVAGLTRMKHLRVGGRSVTDAGAAHLKGLVRLETLTLMDTRVTTDGLAHLRGLVVLKELDLTGSKVDDLAPLRHLPLEGLNVSWNPVGDDGLAGVAGMTSLTDLNLSQTRVTGPGLAHLAGLPRMDRLFLQQTAVTDDGLSHLGGLPKLKLLFLDRTRITDAGLDGVIRRLPSCRQISVGKTYVTDETINRIRVLDLDRSIVRLQ